VGVLIFGLVASVGAFLPENLAFADDDDDDDRERNQEKKELGANQDLRNNREMVENINEEFSLLKAIISGWNSAIDAMDSALASFETRLTGIETQMEEDKVSMESLQTQVDTLSGTEGISSLSGIVTMTQSYTNTVSHSIGSGGMGALSASCEEGDLAISGQFEVISGNSDTMDIMSEKLVDMKTFSVQAENIDSVDSFDIDVSVNCILATAVDELKASDISGLS